MVFEYLRAIVTVSEGHKFVDSKSMSGPNSIRIYVNLIRIKLMRIKGMLNFL